jgi:hypothetical protein
VFTPRARARAGASVAVLAVVVRTWNRVGLLIYACLAALACFRRIGHSLAHARCLPL